MLMEPESKKVVDKEEKYPSNENVKPEIKCNFQFNFDDDKFQTSNSKFLRETILNIEIEEFRELMEKVHKPRYCKMRHKGTNMIHFIVQVCIIKINRRLQNQIWKPGELKDTTIEAEKTNNG